MKIFGNIFKTNKNKKNHAIFLDFGEGSVKAIVVEVDNNKHTGTIIGKGAAAQKPGSIRGGMIVEISQVLETFKTVIWKVCQEAKITSGGLLIGIGGGNLKTMSTTVHYERLQPEKEMTEEELKDIIGTIKGRAAKKVKEEFSLPTSYPNSEIMMLNATIAEIRIDGYKVGSPFGFQGKDISFRVLSIYAPAIYIKLINSLAYELQIKASHIYSIPFVISKAYQKSMNDFSGVIVDVGCETTAVSIIQDGVMLGIKAFSIGGAAFTRTIARKLNLDPTAAEKLKIQYAEGKTSEDLGKKVNEAVKNDAVLWLKGVELALADFSTSEILPGKFYLSGGGSLLPEIAKILNTSDLSKNLPIIENIEIKRLDPASELANIVAKDLRLSPGYNGAISLASFFLYANADQDSLDKTLWEAIKEI